MPEWLLARWDEEFVAQTSERIASAFLNPPETFVRNPPMNRKDLVLEETDVPGAYRVVSGDATGESNNS